MIDRKEVLSAIKLLELRLRTLKRRKEPKFFDDVQVAYEELLYVYHPKLDPGRMENYPPETRPC